MSVTAMQLNSAQLANVSPAKRLRQACNEFIGMALFAPMLRAARRSSLNGDLFHSNATEVFQSQLDDVLLMRTARSENGGGTFGGLGEALYRKLSKGLSDESVQTEPPAGGCSL